MAITDEDIKRAVGKGYDPTATYIIVTPQDALAKLNSGAYKAAGALPTTYDGDMVILRQQQVSTNQSLISRLRGAF